MTRRGPGRCWVRRGPLPDILAEPARARGVRDAPRGPGRPGDDHGRQRPARLARLRRPRPRDLAHAPLGQRDDDRRGRREDNGGREDHHHLRLVRRQFVRRGGGDGRRLRHRPLGGPRDEGDDHGAGHSGLHGPPGHVRARDTHVRRGLRRRRPQGGRVPRRARPGRTAA